MNSLKGPAEVDKAPQTRGTIADYLCKAQARGVVPAGFSIEGLDLLTGGRTGARVIAVRPGYVLKVLPRKTWRIEAMQAPGAGEGPLWLSGVTRQLPEPLACPTVDVAVHVDNDEWWVLMHDVSHGIRPRGGFTEGDERVLLAALARSLARALLGRAQRSRQAAARSGARRHGRVRGTHCFRCRARAGVVGLGAPMCR